MTFHEIPVGARFRLKPEFHRHPETHTFVWEKTIPTPARETVKFDFQAKNALYVAGIHTGQRIFYVDEAKGTEDKFELVSP